MSSENLINTQLGKYIIQAEIGRGGMGAVYLAYDPELERHVAVKVLAPHLVWQKEFVERFMREARAAARLKHPNIVTIYDVGQQGDWYYFVMEYLEGQSLTEFIHQRGALAPHEVLAILHPLVEALAYAHRRGLVHRDIKPGNVILGLEGEVTLTDFGVAHAIQETRLTATGTIMGTPEYMSPEQAQGLTTDARSDQYSLGVVAYELLSGQVPFQAESALALLHKVAYEPPPPIRQAQPDLPAGVEAVLGRVLTKEPGDRYSSVTAFREALGQALVGEAMEEISTPPPVIGPATDAPTVVEDSISLHTPTATSAQRRRLVWVGVLGGLAALALLAVGVLFLGGSGKNQPIKTPEPTKVAVMTATSTATLQPTYTPDIQATNSASTVVAAALTVGAPTATPTNTPTPTDTSTPTPTRTPTPTSRSTATSKPTRTSTLTPSPKPTTATRTPIQSSTSKLQNPGFSNISNNRIPGWSWWALDNFTSGGEYNPETSFDTPLVKQADDPVRFINGPTLQVDGAAHLKFQIYIFQTVSVPSDATVRFEAWASAFTHIAGVKVAAGIDPNGGQGCGNARWGETSTLHQANGVVKITTSQVVVGANGRATVCLYAEPLYPAVKNAAFFDSAQLNVLR